MSMLERHRAVAGRLARGGTFAVAASPAAIWPGAGSGRAQRWPGGRDSDPPGRPGSPPGPARRTWLAALRPAASIRSRVIRHGGGLDVHIVSCTSTANGVPVTAR